MRSLRRFVSLFSHARFFSSPLVLPWTVLCLSLLLLSGTPAVGADDSAVSPTASEADSQNQVSISTEDDGVTIKIDGKLFTRYLFRSGRRPVLWPVIGPTGQPMTRAYSVNNDGPETEARDHVHHRSIWIGYEGLNGVDFWHEPEADRTRPLHLGEVVHREFSTLRSDGDTALLVAQNDWLDASGKRVCREERTLQFGSGDDQRWIDYQTKFIASDGPVRIGDSKEGVVAVRVASTMKVDADGGGRIITSRGLTDAAMWGTRAEWVDYHGPVDGQTVGIAILAHPDSFNSPPRWHARTYGLFAANPFGEIALTAEKPAMRVSDRPLIHTIEADDSLTLRYRMIFHLGDEKQANIAATYEKYSAQ